MLFRGTWPSSVWVLKELASFIRPSVRVVKINKFPSAVQGVTCRPKASSSSTTCFDEKKLPLPKNVLHLFSDQNNYSNLLSVTWGKEEDCPECSGRKNSFFCRWLGLLWFLGGTGLQCRNLQAALQRHPFTWKCNLKGGKSKQILDFKAVSWSTACLSPLALGGWSQKE